MDINKIINIVRNLKEEGIANSLGGGGIAGTIEDSGYDPNFTPPVDKKKKKKNRRKQVIGMWSRKLRKKK
tara:strand:+ start:748 stop:957 length:210 start_codon:yes stop_codon:yes gene_type:complete